jgi:hypothetical protein
MQHNRDHSLDSNAAFSTEKAGGSPAKQAIYEQARQPRAKGRQAHLQAFANVRPALFALVCFSSQVTGI